MIRVSTEVGVPVDLLGMQPQVVLVVVIVHGVALEWPAWDAAITSVTDGKHSSKSKHYRGLAVDVDDTGLAPGPDGIDTVLEMLRYRLGPQFDVLHHNGHFHIEWDPER